MTTTTKSQNSTMEKPATETYAAANASAEIPGQKQEKKTLKEVFEKELNDIYSAEQQLVAALPEMAKAAYSEELEEAFLEHTEQTKKHVARLEKIFSRLSIQKNNEKCIAMEGLIKEGKKAITELQENVVRDTILIISAQKVEHYEIAAYGSLAELADVLGYHQTADFLERTLEEEKETDALLTELASDINDEAAEEENQ